MRKKKIAIATDEEVAAYGGDSTGGKDPGETPSPQEQSASQPEQRSQEAQADAVPAGAVNEAEQWKEKCLRAKADLLNYQRRAEKDRADSLKYANAGLVRALLPALDDLERVVTADHGQANGVEAVVSGVRLTLENLLKVLKDFGVTAIEAEGKPFDPEVHEAMMQQPSADHAEPTVLQEVARGYRLHDRVMRPARVIVSKPAGGEPGDGSQREGESGE